MKILTDEEIIFIENTTASRSYNTHARAIEAAVLSKLDDHLKDAARYRVVFDDDLATMKEPLFNARTDEELPEVRWTIWWNGPNKTFIRDAIDAAMGETE